MSRKFQLLIPDPCYENWENMTPVEKGRFCDSCQKQVVDFSKMSDREVAMFFKKPSTGSVCGRFMEEQLNRDIEIPKKRIPWIKYLFQFALPAFLVSAKAVAQGSVVKKDIHKTCNAQIMGLMMPARIADKSLRGKVVDDSGLQIPKASIKIVETGFTVIADSLGRFAIEEKNLTGKIQIEVSSIGYETKKVDYLTEPGKPPNFITIALEQKSVKLDEVVIVSNESPRRTGGVTRCVFVKETVYQRIKKAFLPSTIKVFPNPVQSGTSLNIEWKQPEEGEYMLQLFNQSGQLIFNKGMWIDEDARVLNLEIPHVAAGNYFLRMTNKPSGKSYSEKIIID